MVGASKRRRPHPVVSSAVLVFVRLDADFTSCRNSLFDSAGSPLGVFPYSATTVSLYTAVNRRDAGSGHSPVRDRRAFLSADADMVMKASEPAFGQESPPHDVFHSSLTNITMGRRAGESRDQLVTP